MNCGNLKLKIRLSLKIKIWSGMYLDLGLFSWCADSGPEIVRRSSNEYSLTVLAYTLSLTYLPPPLEYVKWGKRHTLPRPTANPITVKTNSRCRDQEERSSCYRWKPKSKFSLIISANSRTKLNVPLGILHGRFIFSRYLFIYLNTFGNEKVALRTVILKQTVCAWYFICSNYEGFRECIICISNKIKNPWPSSYPLSPNTDTYRPLPSPITH